MTLFHPSVSSEVAASWTEETVRQCLYLYLSLLPLNHRLVHELAAVYTEAIADIKRSVLRVIEQPVRPSCPLISLIQNWIFSNFLFPSYLICLSYFLFVCVHMHTKIAWELNRTESHHLPCRMWLWERGCSDFFYWLKICGQPCGQNVSLFLFYFECIYLLKVYFVSVLGLHYSVMLVIFIYYWCSYEYFELDIIFLNKCCLLFFEVSF